MKQVVKTLAIILLAAGGLLTAGWLSLGFYLSPQSRLAKSDAIVAVSGGETNSRADEAIELYRDQWAPKIIFSGAALDPNGPSNAAAMKRRAVAAGVPAADILLDEVSTNTFENALAVREIIRAQSMKQIILVTSPYHQRRAFVTFRSKLGKGVKIINHSATDSRWRRSSWWSNDYSYRVTVAELQKTLYVIWSDGRRNVD